jgi:hypothetical protein
MRIRNILLTSAAVLFCTASNSFASSATIAHTWVSGSGSDTNPCTFASPCATFTGALAKTTAGGLITAKDAGDFGPVTISQSVTIDGANLGSITYVSGNGAVIDITASANVTIQNLTINGMGSASLGIYDASGGIVIIDNCRIMNFTSTGIDFAGAGDLTIDNSRIEGFTVIGVEAESNAAENVVIGNTVIVGGNLGYYGFVIDTGSGPVKASLDHVTIQGATSAALNTASGSTEISNSVLTQSYYAVLADTSTTVSLESSMLTQNSEAVCSMTGAKIRLENNDIFDNGMGVANCGGQVKTNGNNRDSGNTSGNPILAADVSATALF